VTLGLNTPAFVCEERLGPTEQASAADIPDKYAMTSVSQGRNISIPYTWGSPPSGTKSFALTLVDSAPVAHNWVHWMVVDISASATGVAEGASGTPRMPSGAVELRNTFGFPGYGGPQPPPGTGQHPYVATLYALDISSVNLPASASLDQFRQAIHGHVLAEQTCTGRLGR
jgi:Raf kinase inhibitor-like YbhB/YbcL family protein